MPIYASHYRTFILCLMLITSGLLSVSAEINVYEFAAAKDEARFNHLINELRCPKCQNQNIADSNAPLAQDLKNRVYQMIQEGQSDQMIMDYMVERYGDYVTYRPPFRPLTWLLWLGPFVFGAILFLIYLWLRKHLEPTERPSLSHEEETALNDLLTRYRQPASTETSSRLDK